LTGGALLYISKTSFGETSFTFRARKSPTFAEELFCTRTRFPLKLTIASPFAIISSTFAPYESPSFIEFKKIDFFREKKISCPLC